MKKKLLSAVVVSMMTLGVMAQVKKTASSNDGNFIIKGGVNLANISVTNGGRVDGANALTSFNVGIGYDIPFAENFSFQPGLMYTGKGAKTHVGQSGSNFYYTATSNPMYL